MFGATDRDLQFIRSLCREGNGELGEMSWVCLLAVPLLCSSQPRAALPFGDFCLSLYGLYASLLQQAGVCSPSLACAGISHRKAIAAGSTVRELRCPFNSHFPETGLLNIFSLTENKPVWC